VAGRKTKTKKKTRAAPPKRAQGPREVKRSGRRTREASAAGRRGARTQHYLLLIGEDHNLDPAEEALAPLRIRCDRHVEIREALARDLDGALAVLLAPPLRETRPERAVEMVRDASADLPVFVLVPLDVPDSVTLRLYRSGATAVFAFPLEQKLLPALLGELLGIEAPRMRATDADRALERAIRARLRVLGKAERGLRISVRNGVAKLSGKVDRLWKLRSLDQNVGRVPGVTAIDTRALEVAPSGLPDRVIARSIRNLLEGVSSIEDQTLGVSVHDGHVVLMGTVINREEWLHALDLLAMIEGVRSVTNKTTEAPRRKQADSALARRLQERLAALVSGSEEIRVAVLGGVAVLRGKVPLLATKREAEALLSRDDAVARIVNKIEIDCGGDSR
jgi:osmotically-inducible protein OsmY